MSTQGTMTDTAPSPDGRHARKMRHLLLDVRFQLKYTAMILGVALVISVVLGLFLIDKVRENSRMLQIEAAFDEAFQSQLAAADARVVFVMVAAFVIFLLVLAGLSVFITHRMAGPVYVMRRYIREIGTGVIPRVRRLRKGDEFRSLFETLVETLSAMERRVLDEIAVLERVRDALPAESPTRAEVESLIIKKRSTLPAPDRASMPPPSDG